MRVDLVADVREQHGVQLVQHRRRTMRVPPVGGERAEMGGFVRIDRGGNQVPRSGTVPRVLQEIIYLACVDALALSSPLPTRTERHGTDHKKWGRTTKRKT